MYDVHNTYVVSLPLVSNLTYPTSICAYIHFDSTPHSATHFLSFFVIELPLGFRPTLSRNPAAGEPSPGFGSLESKQGKRRRPSGYPAGHPVMATDAFFLQALVSWAVISLPGNLVSIVMLNTKWTGPTAEEDVIAASNETLLRNSLLCDADFTPREDIIAECSNQVFSESIEDTRRKDF